MPGEGLVGKVKLNLLQGDNLERENERGREGGCRRWWVVSTWWWVCRQKRL